MNGDSPLAVGFMEKPYKIIKASSSGIRFTVPSRFMGRRQIFCLHLLKKECPHRQAYTITICDNSSFFDAHTNEKMFFTVPNLYNQNTHNFYLTWFNDVISLGEFNESALLMHSKLNRNNKETIGFIRFETYDENGRFTKWNLESVPVIYAPMTVPKKVDGGKLRWVRMDSQSSLPIDALIGGLEYEPLYIARASHRGSLCPGKYVKSKQCAFIPWGHEEIPKDEFEVLCGYDALWVKCNSSHIPENAFIGGFSEVRHEPLFIGRAWVQNNLIVGKVHLLYKTCYLPYRQREVEKTDYETLVIGNEIRRGETNPLPCYMKMVTQPCF